MRKIAFYEPWIFLFFGVFHLHRIWGLIDREAYASFWLGVLKNRGIFYDGLMGVLVFLCVVGIIRFFRNIHHNYRWRWIYLVAGGYLLFDLFAICRGLRFWNDLLLFMYDITSPYWNAIWLAFILLGGFSFALGIALMIQYRRSLRG